MRTGRQTEAGNAFLLFFSCPVVAGGIASSPPPRLLRLTVTRTENTDGNGRRVAGVGVGAGAGAGVPAFQPVGMAERAAKL